MAKTRSLVLHPKRWPILAPVAAWANSNSLSRQSGGVIRRFFYAILRHDTQTLK
jgi:hypothetical protein